MPEDLRPVQLGVNERLWRDGNNRTWLVKATFGRVGERIEIVELRARSSRMPNEERLAKFLPIAGGGTAVYPKARALRTNGRLGREMKEHYLAALCQSGMLRQPGNERIRARWLAPRDRVETPLEEVAEVYNAALDVDQSTRLAVSQRFFISSSAAAKRIRRAREAGLLPKARRGRPARKRP